VEGGDISNEMAGRILVVANDFLLTLPTNTVYHLGRGFGRWAFLAKQIEIDDTVRLHLHDFTWRRNYRVDVVIVGVPEQLAERMAERFDRMNLAIANTYAVPDVRDLVNRLPYMPEVLYIVHDRPEWEYTFGAKAIRGVNGLRSI